MISEYIEEKIEELETAYKYGLAKIYDGNLTPNRIRSNEKWIATVMQELHAINCEIRDLNRMLSTIERIENKYK